MNLIPKIAEMLGVEIGEEFDLCNGMDSSIRMCRIYKFSDSCLMCADEDDKDCFGVASDKTLRCIINGSLKVIKLPFEPKKGDKYFIISVVDKTVFPFIWDGTTTDYCYKACGNCFRTEKEAEKHKHEIYEKLTGRKWEEHESTD